MPHGGASPRGGARPYLGIHFDCCGVYARVYRNRDQTAYEGRCPRCLPPNCLSLLSPVTHITAANDEDGVATRFFRAS